MKQLRIGLDLDGVVYDLVKQMLPLLGELAGRQVFSEHIVDFNIPHALGLTISNRDLFQEVAEQQLYSSANEPIVMARNGIRTLIDRGHAVKIVTSRPRACKRRSDGSTIAVEDQTTVWVHQFVHDRVVVEVRGENFEDPTEKVKPEDRFDIFVDDDPRSLARIGRIPAVKTRPIAFDQPWNQSWAGDRVANWQELVDLVRDRALGRPERIRRTIQDISGV